MARSRARFRSDVRLKTQMSHVSGGSAYTAVPRYFPSYRESEQMTDTLTEGFFSPKELNYLPCNPLVYSCVTTIEAPQVTILWDGSDKRQNRLEGCNYQYWKHWHTLSDLVPSVPSYSLYDYVALAKAKVLEEVAKPEYSFGEPIAEIVRTIATIRQPLTALKRIAKRFHKRRGNLPKRLRNDAEAVSDLWLSYSVNAAPNVQTLNDAVDAFARRGYHFADRRSAYYIAKMNPISAHATASKTLASGYTAKQVSSRTVVKQAKAQVYYQLLDANDRASYLGLRARDMPGLIWELVPLSFVIDRIYNVKRFINVATMFQSSKVRILSGCTVLRTTDTLSQKITGLRVSGSRPPVPDDTPPHRTISFSMIRTPWTPSIGDVLPRNTLSSMLTDLTQTADAASLVIKFLSGK